VSFRLEDRRSSRGSTNRASQARAPSPPKHPFGRAGEHHSAQTVLGCDGSWCLSFSSRTYSPCNLQGSIPSYSNSVRKNRQCWKKLLGEWRFSLVLYTQDPAKRLQNSPRNSGIDEGIPDLKRCCVDDDVSIPLFHLKIRAIFEIAGAGWAQPRVLNGHRFRRIPARPPPKLDQ